MKLLSGNCLGFVKGIYLTDAYYLDNFIYR